MTAQRPIFYLKLISGEDIVCNIQDMEDYSIYPEIHGIIDFDPVLLYPMQLSVNAYLRGSGMFHMMKWIPFSNKHEFLISLSTIMYIEEVTEDEYKDAIAPLN